MVSRILCHYHATYSNYARVSVLVHRSLQFCLVECKTDLGSKYVLLNTYIADTAFVIVDLYLLPPAAISLLYSIMHLVTQYRVPNVFIAGDFNFLPNQGLDRLHIFAAWTSSLSQWATSLAL